MGHFDLLNTGVTKSINESLHSVKVCQGPGASHAGTLAELSKNGSHVSPALFLLLKHISLCEVLLPERYFSTTVSARVVYTAYCLMVREHTLTQTGRTRHRCPDQTALLNQM